MSDAYKILQMNCSDLSNVKLFQLALSDKAGNTQFYIRENGDTSSMYPDQKAKTVQVKMDTADNILKECSKD